MAIPSKKIKIEELDKQQDEAIQLLREISESIKRAFAVPVTKEANKTY